MKWPRKSREFWLRWAGILIMGGLGIELISFGGLQTPGGFLTFAIGSGTFLILGVASYLCSHFAEASDVGAAPSSLSSPKETASTGEIT